MELIAVWQFVKRRWWLMVLPAVVAFVITLPQLAAVLSPSVGYTVQMRLTAAAPPDAITDSSTAPYEDSVYVPLLASEYVVVNMPAWITSDSFAGEVAAILADRGLDIPASDLSGAFNADSFRSILTLYVGWDSAAEIREIADAALMVLQTRSQVYFPQFAAEPLQVVALDTIEVVEAAPPLMTRLEPLVRVTMGLALGVGLALVAEFLDRSLRDRQDVEALGLKVIGEIPRD